MNRKLKKLVRFILLIAFLLISLLSIGENKTSFSQFYKKTVAADKMQEKDYVN